MNIVCVVTAFCRRSSTFSWESRRQIPNDTDFYYPYQIKGHKQDKIIGIGGLDSFHTIQLAMNIIGVELAVIEKKPAGKFVWDGSNGDDLGFRKPNWRD
jgi:hypothetical protein